MNVIDNRVFGTATDPHIPSGEKDSSALNLWWRPYWGEGEEGLAQRQGYTAKDAIIRNCTIYGQSYAEGLKLSFPNNVIVEDCVIYGGYEDVVDIVRGVDVIFRNCEFYGSQYTKQFFTIKGGVKNVTVVNCQFRGMCRGDYIFNLGDWTDYDHWDRPKTRNIHIFQNKINPLETKKLYRGIYSEVPTVRDNYGSVKEGEQSNKWLVFFYWLYQKCTSKKAPDARDRKVYPIEK